MYPWGIHHLKNHQDSSQEPPASLRLHDDALETHGRCSTSQEGRDLKIDIELAWCILETSTMSKITKTPLRNRQCPLRLQGWHLGDALENTGVGRLSWMVESWKLICSFLDVSLGHLLCQKPPRLLSGTTSVLHGWRSRELWSWTTFQEVRDLKIDMQLP